MVELNQSDVAEMLGMTVQQIRNWEREGLIAGRPEGRSKMYDAGAAVRIFLRRRLEEEKKSWEVSERSSLQARKLAAEAEAKEIDLSRLRRETMPTEEHELRLRGIARRIRDVADAAPARFGAELRPDDLSEGERVLEKIRDELLLSLADAFPTPNGADPSADSKPKKKKPKKKRRRKKKGAAKK